MKKIIILIIAIIIIGTGIFYFSKNADKNGDAIAEMEKIKKDYPDLTEYADRVIKWQNKMDENEDNIENYTGLGLAWKSFADWAGKHKELDNKKYYRQALEVYEKGIKKTNRKNTLFMSNAGIMAKDLGDYSLAENYFKEAIFVAPGDVSLYVLLAELYEYKMNKTEEEIIAVYDDGIKVAVDSGFLVKRKESYLKRVEENK